MEESAIHILPVDDLRPHIESLNCPCEPKYNKEENTIVHNAYDGRDRIEKYDENFPSSIDNYPKINHIRLIGESALRLNDKTLECVDDLLVLDGISIDYSAVDTVFAARSFQTKLKVKGEEKYYSLQVMIVEESE